ncbi:MAG: ABC transporter permease [Deltaproteobacteria bacterium]|nr:ABC transporter permease [Deltaproteobacteria bacterium]
MTPVQRAIRGTRSEWRLHALSVFSVSVAFVCLALALLVVVNVDAVRDAWARSGRASAFLRAGTTDGVAREIEAAVAAAPGVRSVRYVAAAAARDEILAGRSDAVLAALPPEAFPASLEVTLTDDANATRAEEVARLLGALPAVESVDTYRSFTERLAAVLRAGVAAAGLLSLVVLGAVVSVVASTIRLSLQRRSDEVEVLKLIGATDDYVRGPFVIEGAAQGALGSLLAVGIVFSLYAIVAGRFDGELSLLLGGGPRFLPWQLVVTMVVAGGALGAAAAWGSLRKLLTV